MGTSVVVVGSLNADFVIRVGRFPVPGETIAGQDFKLFPGGKGANQAYAAAKLGSRVALIGQVGNDTHAEWLKANLASAGVDVSNVLPDRDASSGVATITIDGRGQNQIIIVPGANGTFEPGRLERSRDLIRSAAVVLLQLEIPVATVQAAARMAKEAGASVLLDPAPAQSLSDELLALADYVTPNETELAILTDTPPAPLSRAEAGHLGGRLRARGARKVIVKMGAQGALFLGPGQEQFWPAIKVKAVDTTAAGDAFNAAFAAALAGGAAEGVAGQFATAAAACSVTRAGAQPSMPSRGEVEALLERTGLSGGQWPRSSR
jgi:ribokinase